MILFFLTGRQYLARNPSKSSLTRLAFAKSRVMARTVTPISKDSVTMGERAWSYANLAQDECIKSGCICNTWVSAYVIGPICKSSRGFIKESYEGQHLILFNIFFILTATYFSQFFYKLASRPSFELFKKATLLF